MSPIDEALKVRYPALLSDRRREPIHLSRNLNTMKNITDTLIQSLSREEYRSFKYFLQGRANGLAEREDLTLLEQIRSGKSPKTSTNAMYQTRKRLKKQLEQFALLENLKHDEFSKILRFVEMAKFLFRKTLFDQAWAYLMKAERLAEEAEEYQLLDQILNIQLAYSYNIVVPAPEGLFVPRLLEKRKQNLAYATTDSNFNAAYGQLIYEIRKRLSGNLEFDIDELSKHIFKEYQLEKDYSGDNNWRIFCKQVSMVCRILREKKDFKELNSYAIQSYETLERNSALDKVSPDFRIDLIDTICVAAIRAKDYLNYEKYINLHAFYGRKMQGNSSEQTYYDFIPYVDVADLYFVTNRLPEARERLLAVQKKYAGHTHSARIFCLLRMSLMALHFKYGEYDHCIRLYQEMMAYDERKILDERGFRLEIVLNTKLYGVLFYYEDGDSYYAEYLIQQIKRRYAGLLKSPEGKRERMFLKIMEKVLNKPGYLKSQAFVTDSKAFIALKAYVPGDWEYISLNAWLASKSGRTKSYYDCYLELVKPNTAAS